MSIILRSSSQRNWV